MASEPRYLHRLLGYTLTALRHPEAFDDAAYARTLMTAAHGGETLRVLVAGGLREALGGTSVPRNAAGRVLQQVGMLAARVATGPGVLAALTAVKRDPGKALPPDPSSDWDALQETLTVLAEPGTRTVLDLVAALLRQLAETPLRPPPRWAEDLQVYLSDPDVAAVVEQALVHVADAEPLLIALIRHAVMSSLWRQPLNPFQ
jgi:hypothetical protein